MTEARSETPRREPSGAWSFVRWLISSAISLACLAASIMAFYNVFGVSVEVEMLANKTACQGQSPGCTAQFTFWERTPWAHSLHLLTTDGSRRVQCKREYLLYGTWSCTLLDKLPETTPSTSASASPSVAPPAKTTPPQSAKPRVAKAPAPAATPAALTAPSASAATMERSSAK